MAKDIVTVILLSGTIFTLSCISLVLTYYTYHNRCNPTFGQIDDDIEIPRATFCVTSEPATANVNERENPPIEVEAYRNNILCLDNFTDCERGRQINNQDESVVNVLVEVIVE